MHLFVYGWPYTGYGGTLFSARTVTSHDQGFEGGYYGNYMQRTYACYHLFSIMFGTRICLVLASQSIATGGSVAGSPKVHGGNCLIRFHTITILLDFTRCSPSCSSYIRHTFVHLSCTYNQLTHSLQHIVFNGVLSPVGHTNYFHGSLSPTPSDRPRGEINCLLWQFLR